MTRQLNRRIERLEKECNHLQEQFMRKEMLLKELYEEQWQATATPEMRAQRAEAEAFNRRLMVDAYKQRARQAYASQ